jgi:hypothetical protein
MPSRLIGYRGIRSGMEAAGVGPAFAPSESGKATSSRRQLTYRLPSLPSPLRVAERFPLVSFHRQSMTAIISRRLRPTFNVRGYAACLSGFASQTKGTNLPDGEYGSGGS